MLEFRNTQEAVAFGQKATRSQVKELKRLQEISKNVFHFESRNGDLDAALAEAFRAQFYREALEAATHTGS